MHLTDSMTLILKLDLDIVQIYLHAKNEIPGEKAKKVMARRDRRTDIQPDTNENITYPHSRVETNTENLSGTRYRIEFFANAF